MAIRQYIAGFTTLVLVAALSGCHLSPDKVTNGEQFDIINNNLSSIQDLQTPLPAKITIPHALARALKYNLDKKLHKYKIALATGQAKLAKWQLLPNPQINYDEAYRSNNYVSLDKNKVPSESGFTPQNIETLKYNVTWNILDFGLSYIRARQKFNEIHITQEQERKIVQQLVSQVMIAYWKAYQMQLLEPQLLTMKAQAEKAIWRSKKIQEARVSDDITQLEYQQLLIRNLRRMNKLYLQIATGKNELASLISAPPNAKFSLAPPPANFTHLKALNLSLPQLGTIALVYRPELRGLSYRRRIAESGVSEAVLNILPSANLMGGREETSNAYVKYQHWYSVNAAVTWSLIKLLSLPHALQTAHAQMNVEKLTQAALSLAVIMQVDLAYNEYNILLQDYDESCQETDTESQIYHKTELLLKAFRSNKQAVVRRELNYYNSKIDQAVALAAMYTALGKLKMAVGMQYLPNIGPVEVDFLSLNQLTQHVAKQLNVTLDKSFSQQADQTYHLLMEQVAHMRAVEAAHKQAHKDSRSYAAVRDRSRKST